MIQPLATLLIVDDHLDNLEVLATILRQGGYRVREAANGAAALDAIQVETPDLVLLDINMPHMSGYDVCAQIKADPKTAAIPVIFLSALSDVDEKVKAFATGGADYITKPFQTSEVLARVQYQLIIRQQQQRLSEQNHRLQQEILHRQQVEAALRQANAKLQHLALLDSLTQIANRRRFDEYLQQEWQRLQRKETPLSLILCDIDFFKRYNDRYGHQAGDACLKQVTRALQQVVKRSTDLIARYGGEEFAIILPDTDHGGAVVVAQQIRDVVRQLQIPHRGSDVANWVTLSLGIACMIPTPAHSPRNLVEAADQALYSAKQNGRDCYHLYSSLQCRSSRMPSSVRDYMNSF
ncbi:MAG: diguanylate cyclase [Synechococcales cyanobacterium M58_A2018_015]|nr:diguanylate cyclase [Synechococcales cyanobacterium M58_A2018_015]